MNLLLAALCTLAFYLMVYTYPLKYVIPVSLRDRQTLSVNK